MVKQRLNSLLITIDPSFYRFITILYSYQQNAYTRHSVRKPCHRLSVSFIICKPVHWLLLVNLLYSFSLVISLVIIIYNNRRFSIFIYTNTLGRNSRPTSQKGFLNDPSLFYWSISVKMMKLFLINAVLTRLWSQNSEAFS